MHNLDPNDYIVCRSCGTITEGAPSQIVAALLDGEGGCFGCGAHSLSITKNRDYAFELSGLALRQTAGAA